MTSPYPSGGHSPSLARARSDKSVHYNNGITFLCRKAVYHLTFRQIHLTGTQIVNGGQTIRVLHQKWQEGSLRENVMVPVRVVTGSGDKDFANDVAVNQNNQNRMEASFLRSNDARVVQLDHALASQHWFLERREREVRYFTPEEVERTERRIGRPLPGAIIPFKDGLQAYVATFFGRPETAKKDPALLFRSDDENGYFDSIFDRITPDDFITSYEVKRRVDDFIKRFSRKKNRKLKSKESDWQSDYAELLGREILNQFADRVDEMVPQSGIFLCGALYQHYFSVRREPASGLVQYLDENGDRPIIAHVYGILDFECRQTKLTRKSWPSLLKNQTFFDNYCADMLSRAPGSPA